MVKPNYAFAKRQRDLAKKNKKEEKRLRKIGTDESTRQETQLAPTGEDKSASERVDDQPTAIDADSQQQPGR